MNEYKTGGIKGPLTISRQMAAMSHESMLQTRLLAKACIITQTHKNTNCSNYTFLPTPKNDDDWIFNNRSIRERNFTKKSPFET